MLQIEAMYQFCEFFYLLKARRIETAETISALADIHNRHLDALSRDTDKMKRLGLNRARVLDAIFTADTLPRLIEIWRERPGHFDQSNLARLLATVMSSETCRKLIIASAEAGFLSRTGLRTEPSSSPRPASSSRYSAACCAICGKGSPRCPPPPPIFPCDLKRATMSARSEPRPATGHDDGDSATPWSHLLTRGIGPAALALTLGLAGPARAELVATQPAPIFSTAYLQIIARNSTLRSAATTSPWLVHRILRVLEGSATLRDSSLPQGDGTSRDIDPAADPDLQALQRSSPEAVHELFLLIKKASKERGAPR